PLDVQQLAHELLWGQWGPDSKGCVVEVGLGGTSHGACLPNRGPADHLDARQTFDRPDGGLDGGETIAQVGADADDDDGKGAQSFSQRFQITWVATLAASPASS